MAKKMTEWPSKRGPITKIMPSDGCKGDTVPLEVGKWYEFHEFGWHPGNVSAMPQVGYSFRVHHFFVFAAPLDSLSSIAWPYCATSSFSL